MGKFRCLPEKPFYDAVYLHEDDCCEVVAWGPLKQLELHGAWNDSIARLAHSFDVRGLHASTTLGWVDDSIEFLDELPRLTEVLISPSRRQDWKPLERHPNLEYVGIYYRWCKEQNDIDFTRVRRLRECEITWLPQGDSIRHCASLKSLMVFDDWRDDLRELDLRELVDLEELILKDCGQLREIELADSARIRNLDIWNCPKLKLDMKRYARDLEYLQLLGRVAFPLDDLGLAKHLKDVGFTSLHNKVPIPAFMGKLPCLENAGAHDTLLSEPDCRIADAFLAKRQAALKASRSKEKRR